MGAIPNRCPVTVLYRCLRLIAQTVDLPLDTFAGHDAAIVPHEAVEVSDTCSNRVLRGVLWMDEGRTPCLLMFGGKMKKSLARCGRPGFAAALMS